MLVQEMSESHIYSRMSKVKKKMTLAVQGTIIMGALLMSIVWLVPYYAASSPITTTNTIIPAAFATAAATCGDFPATITGTDGNDTLVGTPQRDVIAALGGNDRVQALGGDDKVCGGDGDDLLNGTDGDDYIDGGTGTDDGDGGPGFNTCFNLEIEANCQA
jgi:Ca2+-binding RTX toxin-like protein